MYKGRDNKFSLDTSGSWKLSYIPLPKRYQKGKYKK